MTQPITGATAVPGGVGTGAIVRSINAMTVGAIEASTSADVAYQDGAIGEIDQQFQITFAGTAAADPAWFVFGLHFPTPFLDGRDARRAPFKHPNFTSGVVLTKGGNACFVTVNLVNFDGSVSNPGGAPTGGLMPAPRVIDATDQESYITDCAVCIGIFAPGASDPVDFKGEMHLNFQGYGMPQTPDSPDDDS